MGTCAPLLIQMPILLVIYRIIMNITSEVNEFYLYDFLKGFHISQIDYSFFGMNLLESG
jgi:membrane protein insertase Oxa1/YidC/SpoIIIJ